MDVKRAQKKLNMRYIWLFSRSYCSV